MGVAGETRYTLTAITFDGADRIAHLASHMTNTIEPGIGGGVPGRAQHDDDGRRHADVNVDRGIVVHTEQQRGLRMRCGPPAGGTSAPSSPHARHGRDSVSDLVK